MLKGDSVKYRILQVSSCLNEGILWTEQFEAFLISRIV
jgi:hypothetical protein